MAGFTGSGMSQPGAGKPKLVDGKIFRLSLLYGSILGLMIASSCSANPASSKSGDGNISPNEPVATGKPVSATTPQVVTNSLEEDVVDRDTTFQSQMINVLEPRPGLLLSGTRAVSLRLTTSIIANCRWSETAGSSYDNMPNEFQEGQGTRQHSTMVSGFDEEAERWLYVRCRELPDGKDLNVDGWWTHLRVMAAWDQGYPHLANLWGNYEENVDINIYAGYDLFVPYWWPAPANQVAALREINPSLKILHNQYGTKGRPELVSLTAEWWNSQPGDPGYNCLLRDSKGKILLAKAWNHPAHNMTIKYCRDLLAQSNIDNFLSQAPDQGGDLAYDGIYWDMVRADITWFGDDIDANGDGNPDDLEELNRAYQTGMEDFLTQIRAALPNAILIGNDAPQSFAPWLNGPIFEWQLNSILNGGGTVTWNDLVSSYRDWSSSGHEPHATIIQNASDKIFQEKYFLKGLTIPAAMEAEAAASYQRMRFGLTTALMGDGLYSYDYGFTHGQLWWYDEYGAPVNDPTSKLPPHGYLGQPTGNPELLVETLNTPDLLSNGGFDEGQKGWGWWVDGSSGANAQFEVMPGSGINSSAAARFVITKGERPWQVLLLQQKNLFLHSGQSYTLSFWARSDHSSTLHAKIVQDSSLGADTGFDVQTSLTSQWQRYTLSDVSDVSINKGELRFELGGSPGEIWLDEVHLQAGSLGVWARPFQNGLAVVNSMPDMQTVTLSAPYCKLNGRQAPLYQTRVDDDQADASAGWTSQTANNNQFGLTVLIAPAGKTGSATYLPALAFSGEYEVLTWVTPGATQNSSVPVTIHHARGETTVILDESSAEIGWRNLGTYSFEEGRSGSVTFNANGSDTVVADAVKWVSVARYNDGSLVRQLTLQPLDGIVLLSSCYQQTD
jgi:hypothetical protein